MAKANLEGVPAEGSRWELDGVSLTVTGFQAKGRGGYVLWETPMYQRPGSTTLSVFRSRAKAA